MQIWGLNSVTVPLLDLSIILASDIGKDIRKLLTPMDGSNRWDVWSSVYTFAHQKSPESSSKWKNSTGLWTSWDMHQSPRNQGACRERFQVSEQALISSGLTHRTDGDLEILAKSRFEMNSFALTSQILFTVLIPPLDHTLNWEFRSEPNSLHVVEAMNGLRYSGCLKNLIMRFRLLSLESFCHCCPSRPDSLPKRWTLRDYIGSCTKPIRWSTTITITSHL